MDVLALPWTGPLQVPLVAAATPADFMAARMQMAFTLGVHIVFACFGIGLPALTVFAEWRGVRTGDPHYLLLARRWAKAMGVLFAVGAVSGTILSFEMGTLWPRFMAAFGPAIGLPFAIEGIAFFVEAIFLGIYLYGWDRLPPKVHVLTGIPIVLGGLASAFFVVTVNAFMNDPAGIRVEDGRVVEVRPLAAMFNQAVPTQTSHMIVAAFLVASFGVASVYAVAMLRGRRDRYHRLGLILPFTVGAVLAPVQFLIGDLAARYVADHQPAKFAAMEGVLRTEAGAPFHLGGIVDGDRMRFAVQIPNGLSLLLRFDPDAVIRGLDSIPPDARPPVAVVHLSFQVMVGIGTLLMGLAAWFALTWWRRRDLPRSPWFLRLTAVSGVLAAIALEAGWVTTEVGRQPWIVHGVMRTADAVNPNPGLTTGLYVVLAVYVVLVTATVVVLRRMTRSRPVPPRVVREEADSYAVV
ncbi:cytochrome ubiquinol oxidase subunit I [Carbonactinospora thermoautotrophica]|uniref:cytochrome ubiquinol oxidase subunit I n=1 Tax=Carbonactinospora thermoautotrophica TaxID=1469144 RepID=UPI00082C11A4|nr:cytochrome ubiquinol oxidase subunit I [Carbonactinospora thermoautotrophica]